MSRASGIRDEELLALRDYRATDLFSPLDKLAIELAEVMTRTPVDVPDRLRTALLEHLSKGQLAELASAIAWENHRARINRALGVREAGFSDGAVCVLPERD
ncbi:MAG: carboxymuconolactone decarboxylase family protein [Candidatus Binatia bacterium]